jgi:hypothetical protein
VTLQNDEKHLNKISEYFVGVVNIAVNRNRTIRVRAGKKNSRPVAVGFLL